MPFDYSSLLNNNGNGGKITMEYASELFEISYKYDAKNVLELILPKGFDTSTNNYTISFNAKDIFGREHAVSFAVKELSKVPTNSEKIIVDICGEANPAISCSFAVIDMLLQLRTDNKKIVIYLPENLYYKENIIDKYGNMPDVDVKIKE